MTPVLLDTHLLLWVAEESPSLPVAVKALVEDPAQTIYFSAASIWEVAIKCRQQRPDFLIEPADLHAGLIAAGYIELPIHGRHAERVRWLDPIHGDPFDRILVAQALVDGITLVTSDTKVAAYSPDIRLHQRRR
ncbi:type II toxin-antitoxin system VapC family toxin [Sphingomonas sp. T9W2]|uniref:type II toxin-antitoxin system VapC family toxin n=1 Tax=Sphingomonas sp. T9W2 TaxID=3143183 RepID=UPI0031F59990